MVVLVLLEDNPLQEDKITQVVYLKMPEILALDLA